MVSASKVYLVEADSAVNAGGMAEMQNSTAIAAVPSGTFVFREHDVNFNTAQSSASVGAFTLTGGVVSNGNEDVNRGGTLSSLTFTGSLNAPDPATGRGSGTFTDSALVTSSFNYYIVDANNVRLLAGNTEHRRTRPGGTTEWHAHALRQLRLREQRRHWRAGRGEYGWPLYCQRRKHHAGATDLVQDGSPATNVSFTGTYTQAANGRSVLTLTTATNSNYVVWMVSPTRGLFLVNDPNTVQDGSLDLQQTSTFSNSTMNGQFGFVMDGFDVQSTAKDRVGTLQWDGKGKLILNEFTNADGSPKHCRDSVRKLRGFGERADRGFDQ